MGTQKKKALQTNYVRDYRNDVYFVNGIDYQTFVAQGKVAEITDIVAQENVEGEDETIANKLNPALRTYYNVGTEASPTYYALPYFDGIFGTVYDVDLFEDYSLSTLVVIEKVFTVPIAVALASFLLVWIKKVGLSDKYGLIKGTYPSANF